MSVVDRISGAVHSRSNRLLLVRILIVGVACCSSVLQLHGTQPNFQLCFPSTTWFGAPAPTIDGVVNPNPPNPGDPYDGAWRGAFRYVFGNGTITPDVVLQGIKDSSHLYLSVEANNLPSINAAGDPTALVVIALDPDGIPADRERIHIFPIVANATYPYQGDIQGSKFWSQGTDNGGTNWLGSAKTNPSWLTPASGNVKVRYFADASGLHWSLELALPITNDPNTGITLPATGLFGLYINVFRVISGNYAQSSWPSFGEKGCPYVGSCTPETSTPAPTFWGTSTLDASQFQVCKGVSVGSELNDIFTDNSPNSKIAYSATPPNTIPNTFHAYVQNTSVDGNGQAKAASQVTATFRIANWGLPSTYSSWAKPGTAPGGSGLSKNPTDPTDIPATSCTNPGPPSSSTGPCILSTGQWVLNSTEITDYSSPSTAHQCIQVELGGGTGSAWQPSHAFAANAITLDPSGHVQEVTTAGTSAATEPSWNDSGGTTSDGTVIWKDRGLPQAWKPSHSFALNTTSIDPSGHVQIVIGAGTSGTTQPNWHDDGTSTADSSVTWSDLGPGNIGTVFLNNIAIQNMDFGSASKFERVAEISAQGYPARLTSNGVQSPDQVFDLFVTEHHEVLGQRPTSSAYMAATASQRVDPAEERRVTSQMTWVAHGCRHTGMYMTINEEKHELCETVGAFGYVVRHVGAAPVRNWNLKFTGAGLVPVTGQDNTYEVHVAQDGTGTVTTSAQPTEKNLAVFIDGGYNVPQGNFGNIVGHGFSFNAGLEYALRSYVSIEGIFGYHHFPKRSVPGVSTSDLNIYQFSANAKLYWKTFGWHGHPARLFVNGGSGGYHLEGSTHPGGTVGAGLLYELTPTFGLQGSYNIHFFNDNGTQKFSTAQAGLRFMF